MKEDMKDKWLSFSKVVFSLGNNVQHFYRNAQDITFFSF